MRWVEAASSEHNGVIPQVVGWLGKSTFSVVDQAVFSGSSLLVNLLLARWLAPREYGGFVITFAIFLILAGVPNSFVLEPMSVFGSRLRHDQQGAYFAEILWLYILITMGVATSGLVIAISLGRTSVGGAVWALPLSAPLILQMWFVRRVFYMRLEPQRAVPVSLAYGAIVVIGLFILRVSGNVSGFSAFLLLGISSLLVSLAAFRRLGIVDVRAIAHAASGRRLWLAQHWQYGKWALGDWAAYTVSVGIFPLLVGFLGGSAQAAGFRAMQNFVMPLSQVLTSLRMLLLPWFSNRQATPGQCTPIRTTVLICCVLVGLALVYLVPVLLLAPKLVTAIYDRSEYLGSTWLLSFFAVEAVFTASAAAFVVALRAAARPDKVFWSKAASAGVTISLAVYLGIALSLPGLMIALVVGALTRTVLLGWHSWKLFSDPVP